MKEMLFPLSRLAFLQTSTIGVFSESVLLLLFSYPLLPSF